MTETEFEHAVRLIEQGDSSGLHMVYDAYADKIYRLFLGKLHHQQDAEDLTSDFFLRLWEIAPQHQSGRGHRSWLAVIARNMAIDHIRKAGREMPVEDTECIGVEPIADSDTPEETVLGTMQTADLLSSLTEDEQEIVRLHIAAELTFREIADVLKRPLGTVAWKYRQAIRKLQKLAEEGCLL